MNAAIHQRRRMNVLLQMVTALITAILLGQLWLFTVTLDAMENSAASMSVAIIAVTFSVLACGAVWILIRFFLSAEQAETGNDRAR
jgi:cytochrome bd-type quinol oxidase subunit 2